MKPVATLDGYVTPKEALEMFTKALNKLEKEQEEKKEQNKKS